MWQQTRDGRLLYISAHQLWTRSRMSQFRRQLCDRRLAKGQQRRVVHRARHVEVLNDEHAIFSELCMWLSINYSKAVQSKAREPLKAL